MNISLILCAYCKFTLCSEQYRREQIKADLLTVIQMREEFSLRAAVQEGGWAEKLAQIEQERAILREKGK